MKLSEHIKYCQEMMNKHGDHEISKGEVGAANYFKPLNISLILEKSQWIRRTSKTEDKEVSVKTRECVYKLKVDEDIKNEDIE
jgi:hypothetical protein